MSSPEIHIVSPGTSPLARKRSKSSKELIPSKQQKRGHDSEAFAQQSQNTQSFRHLFTFGATSDGRAGSEYEGCNNGGIAGNVHSSQGASEHSNSNENNPTNGKAFQLLQNYSTDDSALPNVTPMVIDKETDVCDRILTPSEQERKLFVSNSTSTPSVPFSTMPLDIDSEQLHSSGFGEDDESEILNLAMTFCGAGKSLKELELEWFEGGQREAIREDLRLKRYKRLRGRNAWLRGRD